MEAKRKDKLLSKRNFTIGDLIEKVKLLERQNSCLFNDLNDTLINQSVI